MKDASDITKQIIDFQKGAFASWYSAISMMQDQAASTVDVMLNQAGWIPEQGRAAVLSWVEAGINERDRLKIYLQDGFSRLEHYLAPGQPAAPAGVRKTDAKEKTATIAPKSKTVDTAEKETVPVQSTKPSAP